MTTSLVFQKVKNYNNSMGYQFFHAYTFSTGGKYKTANCIGEACRDEEFSRHVKKPLPPEWIQGNRAEVEAALDNYRVNGKDRLGHKIRYDGRILRADVVAWPADMSEEDKKKGQDLVLEYYKNKFGSAFRGCLIHKDEPFKDQNLRESPREHLHLFIVPEPGQYFDDLHAGLKAKKAADTANRKDSKEKKAEEKAHGSEAYREAMKAEQDDFYEKVGQLLDLKRKDFDSPRERITKKAQGILNGAKDEAAEITDRANEKLDEARTKAATMTAEITLEKEAVIEEKKELAEKNTQLIAVEKSLSDRDKALTEALNNADLPQKLSAITIETLRNNQLTPEERKRFWPAFFKKLPDFCTFILNEVRQAIKAEKPQIQKKQEQGRGR